MTFNIIEKSTILTNLSYLVSTKFNYNLKILANTQNEVFQIGSWRKDGFEVTYRKSSPLSNMGLVSYFNQQYPIKEKYFEFCRLSDSYNFDSSDLKKLVQKINSFFESGQDEIGRKFYYFSESPSPEIIEKNIDKSVVLFNNSDGGLDGIDYLENCLVNNTEPDYYFTVAQFHFAKERYTAASRALISVIALCPDYADAYYNLATCIYIMYSNSKTVDEKDQKVINDFVIKYYKKAKSLGSTDASDALSRYYSL